MDILLEKKLKRLEDGIAILEEQLISMKRHYEDLLNNLDEDNFSANYKVQQGNMYSKIEQTAEKVTVEVSNLSGEVDNIVGDVSRVEFKADNISSTVTKIYNAAVAVDSESKMTDKSLMYYCNGKYRYYNDVTKKWDEVNSNSIVSQFIQTADGFILDGAVKISGDQIVDGVATLRDNVNVGDASTMDEQRGITFNSVAKISTIKGADLYPDEYAGLSISAPLLKLGSRVDFSNATVTGLYAVFE